MTREEAKQLLELCRPGNQEDRQDPALAVAFALLETDAELKSWFDQQQAVDARISQQINTLEAPADLKASILAGMHLHRAHATEENSEPIIPFPHEAKQTARPRAWWQSPWTGIAALLVVMMVILNVPKSESPDNQAALAGLPPVIQFLSQEISSLKSNQLQFDKRDSNAGNLQTFLASSQAPSPQSIPNYLDKMPTLGCITFEYEGAKLSMICFKNGEVYHLITAEKATFPGTLPTSPEVFECKDKAFRVWVEGEQVKILSVEGTKEDIPEFI
jgi:hypothetical protein